MVERVWLKGTQIGFDCRKRGEENLRHYLLLLCFHCLHEKERGLKG